MSTTTSSPTHYNYQQHSREREQQQQKAASSFFLKASLYPSGASPPSMPRHASASGSPTTTYGGREEEGRGGGGGGGQHTHTHTHPSSSSHSSMMDNNKAMFSSPTHSATAVMNTEEELCSAKRPLTFWPLLALIFYTASGGPFGIEDIVGNVGPMLSLLGYLIFPLVWSVPEGLLTAELSSAFPECAGSVAWVTEAFGPGFGYMRGMLSWFSGVIDNSIYPVLCADYISSLDPRVKEPLPRTLFVLSFSLSLTYLNWRGLDVAGRVAVGVCFASLLPFVVMCVLGFFQMDVSRTATWSSDTKELTQSDWLGMINVIFWNLNSFDSAASFAGEVRNPGYTYPRAMMAAILIVVVSYIFPILVGSLATDIPYNTWTDGTFTQVAKQIGGTWLAGWIVAAAAVSNVGLFLAEMSSDAYQLMGMADIGLLPAFLGHKSKHGTPTYPILLSFGVVVIMSLTSTFESIIVLVNFLYALAEIFEIAAFLILRLDQPDLPRPYKIPLSLRGCVCMMLCPLIFIAIVLLTATWRTWLVSGGLAGVGGLSYVLLEKVKERGVCDFYVSPPQAVPLQSIDIDETKWDEDEEEGDGGGGEEGGGGGGGGEEEERRSLRGSAGSMGGVMSAPSSRGPSPGYGP